MNKGPVFLSLDDPAFDPVRNQQDRQAFREWAESLRNERKTDFRVTDAAITELAHFSLQRSLARAIPPSHTWKLELSADRVRVVVTTPKGIEVPFADSSLGLVIYMLEQTNWRKVAPPTPEPIPFKPFRLADVDPNDPFEMARAEILMKREAAASGA